MLSQSRIEEIENLSLDLLQDVYGNISRITPPIDLTRILHRYNAQIALADFNQTDVAGKLEKKPKGGYKIHISRRDSFQRQAFTIAHELGHIVLHPDVKVDVYRDKAAHLDQEESVQEQEANLFASAILMPREAVLSILKITDKQEDFAEIFKVSMSACSYRLKALELI